jgi:hypothetical protein
MIHMNDLYSQSNCIVVSYALGYFHISMTSYNKFNSFLADNSTTMSSADCIRQTTKVINQESARVNVTSGLCKLRHWKTTI